MVTIDYLVNQIENRLISKSKDIQAQWRETGPIRTRHFTVDDLLEISICMQIYDAFKKNGSYFYEHSSFRERKKTSASLNDCEPILGMVTTALQHNKIVSTISRLVDFDLIEPDPSLYAGGLSMMFHKNFLNPHIDNSHDAKRSRYRRLNLLYYVSPNWIESNGGNLELWDEKVESSKTILSKFNRLVVMETNKKSWHSVSAVQVTEPRCCVSNYYFSKVSPDHTEYFHVTSFTGRPKEILKRYLAIPDNYARNLIAKIFKVGRGKKLVNKKGLEE